MGVYGYGTPAGDGPGDDERHAGGASFPGAPDLGGIAVAPGGTAWFAENSASNVGPGYAGNRIASTDGSLIIDEYPDLWHQTGVPADSSRFDARPAGVTIGKDGAPWFAEDNPGFPGTGWRGPRGAFTRSTRSSRANRRRCLLGLEHRHRRAQRHHRRRRLDLVHQRAQEQLRQIRPRSPRPSPSTASPRSIPTLFEGAAPLDPRRPRRDALAGRVRLHLAPESKRDRPHRPHRAPDRDRLQARRRQSAALGRAGRALATSGSASTATPAATSAASPASSAPRWTPATPGLARQGPRARRSGSTITAGAKVVKAGRHRLRPGQRPRAPQRIAAADPDLRRPARGPLQPRSTCSTPTNTSTASPGRNRAPARPSASSSAARRSTSTAASRPR